MLLSPGHSPRHISTPSTSQNTPNPSDSISITNPSPNSTAIPNSSRKKRGPAVLDEDSYVASIEKIIERDFFPDIPLLRDRLDLLQAFRSGDPVLIRDAQLKIDERRRNCSGTTNRNNVSTPSTSIRSNQSVTPLFGLSATPSGSDPAAGVNHGGTDADLRFESDCDLSLDEFFRKYTSEDNESFNKILEKVNKKRKEKYAHLLEGEKEQTLLLENGSGSVNKDRITDGYGTSGQQVSTLESWKYKAKNLLMYNIEDKEEVPLTEEERAVRLKGMTKEINKSNTRFDGKSTPEAISSKEEAAILYRLVPGTTPAGASWPFGNRDADKDKKYDLEDFKNTPNQFFEESGKKADNGYSFVKTPSPAPGVDESPFMTWGEIDGTPLRLDMDDGLNIGGGSGGPQFSIPLPPTRDVKAHSLSREAARKIRERSSMYKKPPLPFSSPSRGGSASPNVRNFSPAAQKFMRNAIAKSSKMVDETLRASYRGSSPIVGTPKEKSRLSNDGTLGLRSPSAKQGSSSAKQGSPSAKQGSPSAKQGSPSSW